VGRVVLAVAVVVLAAGCGGGDNEPSATGTGTTTAPSKTTDVRVYWLRDGKVWPARREVEETEAVATAALLELQRGPTEQESMELGFDTAMPDESIQLDSLSITDGVAHYGSSEELSNEALAQVAYTLTQFPTVESVEIEGRRYTRADFEDLTPAILVESPLSFETVASPLRATGTANTFEAVFNYELTDTDGRIVAEDFVMATSGTGERGTFEFTVPFKVNFDGVGSLIVFELSAKDGSRINLAEIPVRMQAS